MVMRVAYRDGAVAWRWILGASFAAGCAPRLPPAQDVMATDADPSSPDAEPRDEGARIDGELPRDAIPGGGEGSASPDAPGPFTGVISTGAARRSASCLAAQRCAAGAVAADRETTCGTLTAGGSTWEVPSPLADGPVAADVYEGCLGRGPVADDASRLVTQVIDPDGAVVTAHLFSDNYFELYVNGRMVGRDSLGFTPFNTSAVRFQARYPMTLAVRLVDWEGHLGVGLEDRSGAFHVGDGGFIAAFSNGVVTDSTWRCRPVYIAPLDDPGCLLEDGDGNVDSSRCPSTDGAIRCIANNPLATCRAAHVRVDPRWAAPDFDSGRWTPAALFDAARVTADPAYTSFAGTLFSSARFIWSRNLDLDNQVLCRLTVAAPRS
jgi:hypothetical protein